MLHTSAIVLYSCLLYVSTEEREKSGSHIIMLVVAVYFNKHVIIQQYAKQMP